MTYTEAKRAIKEVGKEELRDLIERNGQEVIEAAIACDIPTSGIEEAYQGQYDSDEDFVQELLEGTGELPSNLPWYIHIDWEATASDIMMDYQEHGRHYFRIF